MKTTILAATLAALVYADGASAACMNRFVVRSDRNQQVVTLLTGMLTFQEAQDLSKKITAGTSPRLEWTNAEGKAIAKQVGELKVIRPMPVGCDGKSSGVVVIASFLSVQPPSRKMFVKLEADKLVAFDEQSN